MLVVNKDNEVENMEAKEVPEVEEIDPRVGGDRADLGPIKELKEVVFNPNEPMKTVKSQHQGRMRARGSSSMRLSHLQ
uniref:Uncharacterized protein n=1 Tax=Cannabis sativa TaxID=3483 RepID=A0A803PRF6_CANSA